MALLSGTQLGSYRVTSLIGAGGMGEVYQARDSKLGRDVAIKVLPEQFAREPERLARFQREAKMLAALNHPNIAAIYGLEQSGNTHYLVMELVEGATLAERILSGPVPLEEALPIARQVADAVEYAHDKNVIHRDLKPANIKVKEDGTVKVLDFGLAKAMSEDPATTDIANSPTLSMAATRAGMILGTAAYMSPEQAKGKVVDRRADVWAFGAVLYEMLTGKQPFPGDDVTEILAAVVMKEPALDALPAKTPPEIRTLLRRCLEKSLRRRLGHISEARILIEDVLSGATGPALEGKDLGSRRKRDDPSYRVLAAIAALGVAAAIALAIPAIMHLREAPPAVAPEMRSEIVTPAGRDPISFALSPDGRQIAFVALGDGTSRLWVRRLDVTEAQPLAGTDGASYPFWSPDSRSVAFFADGKLKRMDIAGGSPQPLADVANARGGAWSPDGTILFAPNTNGPLSRVAASGGQPVAMTKIDPPASQRFPRFLPGGRQFLFYVTGTPETAGIYLGSLDSSETKRLVAADIAGAYFPELPASAARTGGWLLFIRGTTLMAQRLDLAQKALTGDPVTVANPVTSSANFNVGGFSVSATGLVAYQSGGAGQRQLVWYDRSGKTLGAVGAPDANSLSSPRLSPDGARVAVSRMVQGNNDIWLMDATRTTRFTFDAGRDAFPSWSPDGSRIVFDSNRKGHRDLYVKPANGAGNEELLLESVQDKVAQDWSRDGKYLTYLSVDTQASYDIWVLPMEGERKPFVFLKTNFGEAPQGFSPDGRWLTYESNESGRWEVYVRPFNGSAPGATSGGQWQVSTSGGANPRWRSDGKELYYIAPDGKLMAAPVTTSVATFAPGTPVALFQTRIYGANDPNAGPQYDVSRDGRFLINTVLDEASTPITLLQNWNPETKK